MSKQPPAKRRKTTKSLTNCNPRASQTNTTPPNDQTITPQSDEVPSQEMLTSLVTAIEPAAPEVVMATLRATEVVPVGPINTGEAAAVRPPDDNTSGQSSTHQTAPVSTEASTSTWAGYDNDKDELDPDAFVKVADWLPEEEKHLADEFIKNGFDNTLFISGMTEMELKYIGIKRKGEKRYLVERIKQLPDYEIQAGVPDNVDMWLEGIGLSEYKENFISNRIKTSKDMEVLKSFGRKEIENELNITKHGHVKRLKYAIRKLRNPTPSEQNIIKVRKSLTDVPATELQTVNRYEYEFWNKLTNDCLRPQSTAYDLEEDLNVKLRDLRNSWLILFAVANTLWTVLIETIAVKGELLAVFGNNPVGLGAVAVFSVLLIFQFFAMLVHRISTLAHFLGRAPYTCGAQFNTSWTFKTKLKHIVTAIHRQPDLAPKVIRAIEKMVIFFDPREVDIDVEKAQQSREKSLREHDQRSQHRMQGGRININQRGSDVFQLSYTRF